jgi:GNAT superfamily N-acetyltransferase
MPLIIPSICSRFKQFKITCEEVGLKKMCKHAFYVRHEEIFSGGDIDIHKRFPFKNGLTVLAMERKDLDVLSEYYLKADCGLYPKSRIERYFENDCKCFIAMKNDDFVGHWWWGGREMKFASCDPSLRYVGETCELKDYDAFGVDFFLVPEKRGSGIALEFFSKILLSLNELGYKRHFGLVQSHNHGARWLYKLFGFKDLQTIVVHRVLNYVVLIDKKLYFAPHHLSS